MNVVLYFNSCKIRQMMVRVKKLKQVYKKESITYFYH